MPGGGEVDRFPFFGPIERENPLIRFIIPRVRVQKEGGEMLILSRMKHSAPPTWMDVSIRIRRQSRFRGVLLNFNISSLYIIFALDSPWIVLPPLLRQSLRFGLLALLLLLLLLVLLLPLLVLCRRRRRRPPRPLFIQLHILFSQLRFPILALPAAPTNAVPQARYQFSGSLLPFQTYITTLPTRKLKGEGSHTQRRRKGR